VAVAVAWAANKPADREQLDHWPSIVRLLGRLPHFATLLSILCHTLLYSVILQLTSERPKRQSHRQTHGQRRAITHQRRRVAGERKPVGSCTCTCISICRPMTVAARLPTVFGGCRLSRREREREREKVGRVQSTQTELSKQMATLARLQLAAMLIICQCLALSKQPTQLASIGRRRAT